MLKIDPPPVDTEEANKRASNTRITETREEYADDKMMKIQQRR